MPEPSSEAMESLSVALSGNSRVNPALLQFTREEIDAAVSGTSDEVEWLKASLDALFDKTPASTTRQSAAFGRRPMRGKRRAAWLPVAPALREDLQIPGRSAEEPFADWLKQFLDEQSKGADGATTARTLEWWLPSINTNMALPLLQDKLRHRRGGNRDAPDPEEGSGVGFNVGQLKRMLKTGGTIEPLNAEDDDEELTIKVFASVEEAQSEWNKYGQAFVDAAQEAELDVAKLHASIWKPLQGKVDDLLSTEAWTAKLIDAEAICNGGVADLPPIDTAALQQRLNDSVQNGDLDWAKGESVAVLQESKAHALANMAKVADAMQQLNDACMAVADASYQECADAAVAVVSASEAVSKETCAAFPSEEEEEQEGRQPRAANLPTVQEQKEQGIEKLKERLAVADAKATKTLAKKVRFVEARTAGLIEGVNECGDIDTLVALCNDVDTDDGVAKGLDIFMMCAGTEYATKMLNDLGSDQRSMCANATRQMVVWLLKTVGKNESTAAGFVSRKFAENVSNVLAGLTAVRRGYRTKLVEIGVTPIIQTVLSQVSERISTAPAEMLNYVDSAAEQDQEGEETTGETSRASLKQRNDEITQLKRALVSAEKELELQRDQQTHIITAFAQLNGAGEDESAVVDEMMASSSSVRGGGRRNGRNAGQGTAATKRMADSVEMASRVRLENLARARAILGQDALEHVKTTPSNNNTRGNGNSRRSGRGGGGRRSNGRRSNRRNGGAEGE